MSEILPFNLIFDNEETGWREYHGTKVLRLATKEELLHKTKATPRLYPWGHFNIDPRNFPDLEKIHPEGA